MKCTECGEVIPFETEDVTVRVLYKDGRVEAHCHHNPFDESDSAIEAIFGSQHCAMEYVGADRDH